MYFFHILPYAIVVLIISWHDFIMASVFTHILRTKLFKDCYNFLHFVLWNLQTTETGVASDSDYFSLGPQ